MKTARLLLAAFFVVALAPAALAANVHWKSGPTFTDNGVTLTTSGSLAGLGNEDVTITVTAEGKGPEVRVTQRLKKKASRSRICTTFPMTSLSSIIDATERGDYPSLRPLASTRAAAPPEGATTFSPATPRTSPGS